MMKKVISILPLLLLCFPAHSQNDSQTEQKSKKIEIFFDLNSRVVDSDFKSNEKNLKALKDLIFKLQSDSLTAISKIDISSFASPDGGRIFNEKVTKERANSIYDYFTKTISVPDSIVISKYYGIDWDGLTKLVEESDMQYKDEVLYILKNVPEETWRKVNPNDRWQTMVDSRNKHLMDLKSGVPYNYMLENFFPQLRSSSISTEYTRLLPPPVIVEEVTDTVVAVVEEPKVVEPVVEPQTTVVTKPLFALKTNLLYDAMSLVNLEAEVPIGDRWSVAGEFIFPWWIWDSGQKNSKRHRIEVYNGNIEGKYWFGDRTNRPVMTGWNVGLYAGGGSYDFERNGKGYQDKSFISAGLSGGFAHTINNKGNLRMEYSLGIGYLNTNYSHYEAEYYGEDDWRAILKEKGTYGWVGPTKLKVSLVWLLNYKKREVNKW